jgi:hypothetical protein
MNTDLEGKWQIMPEEEGQVIDSEFNAKARRPKDAESKHL